MCTLISNRHKFIFIHIAKNAGTSVSDKLVDYTDTPFLSSKGLRNLSQIADQWLPLNIMKCLSPHVLPMHITADQLMNLFPDLDPGSFYKFSVVRNPYDRMVSYYKFTTLARKRWTSPAMHKRYSGMSFEQYVELLHEKDATNQFDLLFRDNKGHLNMDYVAKMEDLDNGMEQIFADLNLPNMKVPKKNINSSRSRTYRDYYNSHTKKLIEQSYAKDLDTFKYTF